MRHKTCYSCCFAHKCRQASVCEHYCSTYSITEMDDTYLIEQGREAFYEEWIAYTQSLSKE